MKDSNRSIISFFREVAIVVIGILVALFINNWNEGLKHEKFVSKALYAIGEEIKYSKDAIEEILPKHYKTINLLNTSISKDNESLREVFVKINGFQIPEIRNIGLRFFVSNSADLVDYAIISDLSEIEFTSKGFEIKLSKLTDLVYSKMESTSEKDKNMAAELLVELTDSEEDLIELYEDFLSKHYGALHQNTD